MAKKAGMSFASYKRFEQTGEIAFRSLCNIAIALGCEQNFDELFAHRQYTSIQEVIDAQREAANNKHQHTSSRPHNMNPQFPLKPGHQVLRRWEHAGVGRRQFIAQTVLTHTNGCAPNQLNFAHSVCKNSFDNYSPRPKAEPRRSRGRALRA